MDKEAMYLIHGEDYLRHIDEKLEMYAMLQQLLLYIETAAEKSSYLRLVHHAARDFDRRCDELFASWGSPVCYMKSHDPRDLADLIENELIEPEYAGYVQADMPCSPNKRCCEYAENIGRKYADKRSTDMDMDTDEDDENIDVFEYEEDSELTELTDVCRDILSAVEQLTILLRDEFDYTD